MLKDKQMEEEKMMNKQERPYIFCHMETSLDGKIMGKYLWIEETNAEEDSFYALFAGENAAYKPQALLNGRITVEDNFTFYQKPELKENFEPVPEGDFLPQNPGTDFYLIVADPSGKVAWQNGVLDDFYGHQKAQVVELVTEKASEAYKAYLREKGISYLVCGKEHIDAPLACRKIKETLKVETLMLGGGGTINWSFIQQGLVDELSVVIAPAADGNTSTQTLFMAKAGLSDDQPVVFKPQDVKLMPDGKVWLRYLVDGKSAHDFAHDSEYQEVQEMLARQHVR